MEQKSSSIKDTAFTMKNNAKQLEREARKRNCRLWAIIICIIISILCYIVIPIAVKMKKHKSDPTDVPDTSKDSGKLL
jgi:t-SNARE complex subunit (syntaxin)